MDKGIFLYILQMLIDRQFVDIQRSDTTRRIVPKDIEQFDIHVLAHVIVLTTGSWYY